MNIKVQSKQKFLLTKTIDNVNRNQTNNKHSFLSKTIKEIQENEIIIALKLLVSESVLNYIIILISKTKLKMY